MKTLEPILIDTSLRFGQADIMQWFPEVTEEDAQSALVATQEAADAFFSERWSDSTWMLDFDVSAAKQGQHGPRRIMPVGDVEATGRDSLMWLEFRSIIRHFTDILTTIGYQRPIVEHILRAIEETRTREAVEQGRW